MSFPLAGWLACATDWVRPALWWIVATTAVVWGAASGRRGVESLADSSLAYYVSALGIIAVGAVLTFTSSGHLVHAGRHLDRTSPRIT